VTYGREVAAEASGHMQGRSGSLHSTVMCHQECPCCRLMKGFMPSYFRVPRSKGMSVTISALMMSLGILCMVAS